MEEDGEQDAEVDGRVAALLLDAQDAWPPEGIVPLQLLRRVLVPRIKLELEQVLEQDYNLKGHRRKKDIKHIKDKAL